MPKELTHWALAEKVRKRYAGFRLGDILSSNIHLYYLGAVSPDMPYYYLVGGFRTRFAAAADRLHGRFGGNTLAFLPSLIRFYGGADDPSLVPAQVIAFLLGTVCHVTADWNFHPPVYYFCGSRTSDDPAVSRDATERHQELESRLDLLYRREYQPVNGGRIARSFRKAELNGNGLNLLLQRFLFPGERIRRAALRGLAVQYSLVQAAFYSRLLRALAEAAGNRYYQSLFYAGISPGAASLLERRFRYLNPVTGRESTESFRDLERKMISDAADLFDRVESFLEGEVSFEEIEALQGRHLESGLPAGDTRPMRYFDIREPRGMLA